MKPPLQYPSVLNYTTLCARKYVINRVSNYIIRTMQWLLPQSELFVNCVLTICSHVVPPVASVPTNLTAVQDGLTGIRVSWSPPTPLGATTGYSIFYNGGNSSDTVYISGGSSDNYLVTNLQNGQGYNISIVATSQYLPSDSLKTKATLSKFLVHKQTLLLLSFFQSQGLV